MKVIRNLVMSILCISFAFLSFTSPVSAARAGAGEFARKFLEG